MAFDFPSSPTVGQQFVAGGTSYVWNGYGWSMTSSPVGASTGVQQVPYFAEPEMYVTPWGIASTAGLTTTTCAANQIWFVPLVLPWTRTLTSIAISLPVGGSVASSNARLGLFSVDRTSGKPAAVLADAGNVATDTVGFKPLTINYVANAGAYYGAMWTSHAIGIRTIALAYCLGGVGFRLGNASPHAVSSLTRNATFGSAFADESAQVHTLPVGGVAPLIGIR